MGAVHRPPPRRFIYIENQYFLGGATEWLNYDDKEYNVECKHRVPIELAMRIVNKIRMGERCAGGAPGRGACGEAGLDVVAAPRPPASASGETAARALEDRMCDSEAKTRRSPAPRPTPFQRKHSCAPRRARARNRNEVRPTGRPRVMIAPVQSHFLRSFAPPSSASRAFVCRWSCGPGPVSWCRAPPPQGPFPALRPPLRPPSLSSLTSCVFDGVRPSGRRGLAGVNGGCASRKAPPHLRWAHVHRSSNTN